MPLSKDDVLAALGGVTDPASGTDIVSAGIARAVTVEGGAVRFVLEIDPKQAKAMEPVLKAAEDRVRSLAGVTSVSGLMTAHATPKAPPDLKPGGARPERQPPQPVAGVARIVAIASGKGGVGKSTVAANIAVALAAEGRRVGLLDADLYGPSQPRMLGVTGRPASPDGKTIIPLKNHGVTMMSLGLMMPEGQAAAWRGPMLMGALQQMLFQVDWGTLDVLIVDLPPGTGDVQMTLSQKAQVTGAIIVSTPQDIALLDARKGIDMFRKLGTPVLGMIENMAVHVCSNCGHEEHIFGHGGVRAEAEALGVPLLAELPLDLATRIAADSGTPVTLAKPDSGQARAFRALAQRMIAGGIA